MATMTRKAVRLLWLAQLRANGQSCNYVSDGDVIELDGVPGRRGTDGAFTSEINTTDTDAEWLFWAEDLDNDGKKIFPREGDEFLWNRDDGMQERFRVLPPIEGERCWNPEEQTESIYRVYMKHRETNEQ